jgi:hypothetical protein
MMKMPRSDIPEKTSWLATDAKQPEINNTLLPDIL